MTFRVKDKKNPKLEDYLKGKKKRDLSEWSN